MLIGEQVDHDNICSYFGVISKANIKRSSARSVVLIVDGRPMAPVGAWIDGGYHYRSEREYAAPWESDVARESTPGLPSDIKAILEAQNESRPIYLFERQRKGVYRFAGPMCLKSQPTIVQQGDRTWWSATFSQLDLELPRLTFLPVYSRAVIGHSPRQDVNEALRHGLAGIAKGFCYFADKPTTWPAHLTVFPKGAIAVIDDAITLKQRLALSKFLDTVGLTYEVPFFDKRALAQNLGYQKMGVWQDRVQQRKKVLVRRFIAMRKKRDDPEGTRLIDDELDFDGSSDEELFAALNVIGDEDQFPDICRQAQEEVRTPDLEKLYQRLLPDESLDSCEAQDGADFDFLNPRKKLDFSNINFG